MSPIAPSSTLLLALLSGASAMRVFVSGAGGQTGQSVFRKLLARPDEFEPTGIVRSDASRQALLDSGVSAERVIVADVTDPSALAVAMGDGCEAMVICTSAKPAPTGEMNEETGRPVFGFPNGQPEAVDWLGQKHQVDAAKKAGASHVLVCSSMGGTDEDHMLNGLGRATKADGSTEGGNILWWKRKAEMYLMGSGVDYTIVHPGGLINEPGGKRQLMLGVDDAVKGTDNRSVPREDVAEVLVQALTCAAYRNRSFDLVSKPEGEGAVTSDFNALIEECLGSANCDYSLGRVG